MSFEKRVEDARRRKEAEAQARLMQEQREKAAAEEAERQRIEAVKRSPEWKAMVELSRNREFLKALEMYWEKFAEKGSVLEREIKDKKGRVVDRIWRKKKFSESLAIEEHPEVTKDGSFSKFGYRNDALVDMRYGFIEMSFILKSHYNDGCNDYDYSCFLIFYNETEIDKIRTRIPPTSWKGVETPEKHYKTPKGLCVMTHDFIGTVDEFLDYMVEQLA